MANMLKISEAASLAMHTMVLLAKDPERVVSNREIAERLKVSEAHLSKVLQRLTRVGLVAPVRGPKGGFRLSGSPEQITLLKVYESIEGRLVPKTCLFEKPVCGGGACILGDLLTTVNRRIADHLSGTTLSDLVGNGAQEQAGL